METQRQLKVSRLIQKDISGIFQLEGRNLFGGAMVTVTNVRVTRDLSLARIYLSIFAAKNNEALLDEIKRRTREIRFKLGIRVKNQLRAVPELEFYLDDSLDYIENIENLLDD